MYLIDKYTKLLLHCDGANAAVAMKDVSGRCHPITFYGNAQISTAQKKFGNASSRYDGNSDYLTIPNHADFNPGTGAFTIDLWVRYYNLTSSNICYCANNGNDDWTAAYGFEVTSSNFHFYVGPTPTSVGGSWSPVADTWYHIEASRDASSNVRVFVDGSQLGSTVNITTNLTNNYQFTIGARYISSQGGWTRNLDGWIDEFKFSKGVARHTANFTPGKSPYHYKKTIHNL